MIQVEQVVLAVRGAGEDRVAVVRTPGGFVLAVADGSGGMSGGAAAAEQAVRMAVEGRAPWDGCLRGIDELTEWQNYKPLIGSGSAEPVSFHGELEGGTLVAGSDGLFKYARHGEIVAQARGADLRAAAQAVANLPMLRPGRLIDDVAVILCRDC